LFRFLLSHWCTGSEGVNKFAPIAVRLSLCNFICLLFIERVMFGEKDWRRWWCWEQWCWDGLSFENERQNDQVSLQIKKHSADFFWIQESTTRWVSLLHVRWYDITSKIKSSTFFVNNKKTTTKRSIDVKAMTDLHFSPLHPHRL
jgi:hypothetical protein